MNKIFTIDYKEQSEIKDAIELAIWYCETNIPKVDGWSKSGLEKKLVILKDLESRIGNSFVVGHFE